MVNYSHWAQLGIIVTPTVFYIWGNRTQLVTVKMHPLATAVFNVHSLGLCGGRGDPHHLASQLLPGGQTYPFLWKPPAYIGCGCSAILHGFCESWCWNLPEGSGGCDSRSWRKPYFASFSASLWEELWNWPCLPGWPWHLLWLLRVSYHSLDLPWLPNPSFWTWNFCSVSL